MTEKEQLLYILNNHSPETLEDFICAYIALFDNQFPVSRINELIKTLNNGFLSSKISKQENAIAVSKEKAGYLKIYLEGKMYTSKEAEEQNKPAQIKNAETIINVCRL